MPIEQKHVDGCAMPQEALPLTFRKREIAQQETEMRAYAEATGTKTMTREARENNDND